MRTVCCDSTSIQANLLGWTMTLEGVWCCCSSGACNGNLFTKKKSNQKLSSDVRRREHFGNTYNDFSRLLDGNVLGRTDLIPFLFKYKTVNCGNANNASAGMISMKFCSIFNVSNSKPRRIGNLIRRFLFKFKFRMLVRSGTSCSTSKSVNLFCDKSLKTDGNVCCFNKKNLWLSDYLQFLRPWRNVGYLLQIILTAISQVTQTRAYWRTVNFSCCSISIFMSRYTIQNSIAIFIHEQTIRFFMFRAITDEKLSDCYYPEYPPSDVQRKVGRFHCKRETRGCVFSSVKLRSKPEKMKQ